MKCKCSFVWTDSPTGLEVWLAVQLEETVRLNLVLYDQRNTTSSSSSSHLRPPEEPDEEADDRQQAFYCCLPPPPVPQPSNRSHCLVQLANRTALSKAGKRALPWELTGKKGGSRYVSRTILEKQNVFNGYSSI